MEYISTPLHHTNRVTVMYLPLREWEAGNAFFGDELLPNEMPCQEIAPAAARYRYRTTTDATSSIKYVSRLLVVLVEPFLSGKAQIGYLVKGSARGVLWMEMMKEMIKLRMMMMRWALRSGIMSSRLGLCCIAADRLKLMELSKWPFIERKLYWITLPLLVQVYDATGLIIRLSKWRAEDLSLNAELSSPHGVWTLPVMSGAIFVITPKRHSKVKYKTQIPNTKLQPKNRNFSR